MSDTPDSPTLVQLLPDAQRILAALTSDPLQAAAELDALAEKLHNHAETIRRAVSDSAAPEIIPSGMRDRVKMRVQGPDGETRQAIDTGG